jgi:hypothetical protein
MANAFRRLPFARRIAPAVLLFVLAPLFGEYLLGNLTLSELYLASHAQSISSIGPVRSLPSPSSW